MQHKDKYGLTLIDMPLEIARRTKWERGVHEHGNVMSLDPLIELHAELVDALNYIGNLQGEDGWDEADQFEIQTMKERITQCALATRAIHRKVATRRHYTPRTVTYR